MAKTQMIRFGDVTDLKQGFSIAQGAKILNIQAEKHIKILGFWLADGKGINTGEHCRQRFAQSGR